MIFTRFFHRDAESLRERRLIYQQMRNSEAPREQPRSVLERLTDEHANEEDIERVVAELPEESDVYRAVVAEGQKLDQRQRQIVGANLQRLSERVELKAKTQVDQVEVLAKVERMRSALVAPPEERPAEPAAPAEMPPVPEATAEAPSTPAPSEPEQGFLARNWTKVQEYWEKTPTTEKLTHVGVVVGAVAVVGGGYRFLKWLWGGTKQVTEKTVEKTKKGLGWMGTTLLVAGVGIAAFLGWKALENKLKGMLGDLKSATMEQLQAAKLAAEEQLRRMEDAVQRGGDMAQEQLDKLKEEKRKITEQIAAYDRELQERRQSPSAQPSANPPTEAQPVPGPQTGERVREEAEELAEAMGTRLLARGLLAIYPPAPELGTMHESQVNDFIHANQDRPLRDLFACVDADPEQAEATVKDITIRPSVTVLEEDRERREAAAKYVILLCWSRRQSLLAFREDLKPEDIDAMTMKDFVQAFAQGAEAVAGIIETVVAAEGDPKKLRELLNPEQLYLASGAEGELALLISESRERLGLSAQALQNLRPLDVMKFALRQGGIGARQFGTGYRAPDSGPDAVPSAVLSSVCAVMEDETPKFMLPFFHGIFPEGGAGASKAENLTRVRTILMDRMPVSQSVRLYLYQRMMQRGNPVGILLMQAEIFKYVASKDERLLKDAHSQMILAMGDVSLRAIATEGDWPYLPPEVMENGQRLLGFLTEKGARAALTAVVVAPREGLAWLKSAYVRYPLVATPVALLGAYVSKVYSDLSVIPANVIWRVHRQAGRMQSPPLPARILKATLLRPWMASASDVRNAKQLLDDLDAKIATLIDVAPELGNALYDQFIRAFRGLDSERAWRAFAHEVAARRSALPASHPARYLLREIFHKSKSIATDGGVRKAVRLAERPRMNILLTDKLAAGVNVGRDIAGATVGRWGRNWMHEWRTVSPSARALYVAGIGLQGLALYGDYVEIGEIEKQRDSVTKHAESVVDRLRQDLERNSGQFERVSYGVYRHKVSGVEVSLRGLHRQIDTHVGGAFDERELAQKMRTATTASGLAATILVGAKAFTGPAGLVIAGVEITVRTGINAWEQNKMRAFLNDAPPWLLSVLGAQETTGEAEYDWLEKASSWMLSDLWPSSSESAADGNKDKPELRKRMLYSIFVRELMQHAPEAFNESVGGMWSPETLDRFYREDFQQFVLPMFSAQLFASTREGNLSYEALRAGEVGASALGLIATNVTLMEIREAMRRSTVCYLQHVREKRFLEYRALLQTIPTGDAHRAGMERLVAALGGVEVFGQKLSAVDPRVFEQNKGKTRGELALQMLQEQLTQAPGATRDAKLRQNEQLFAVGTSAVVGLPTDIDFSNRDQILGFIEDPVVRLKMQQLTPRTLGEEEEQKRTRWNDWSLSRIEHVPSAVDQMDALFYAAPFHTSNMIAAKLGEPPVHENTNIFDVVGRSRDAASYDQARAYITEGLDRLCSRAQGDPRRSPSYEQLYGADGPIVLTRGSMHPDRRLARLIRYPKAEAAGFETQNLQAVLFEGQEIGGNHVGVLATYVFGDLESGKVSVLQRGAGTFMLASMPTPALIDGLDRPIPLQEFLVRPGAVQVLETARKALAERNVAREAARRQQNEEARVAGETVDAKWKEEAPLRARQKQEREEQRTQLRDRFRQAGIVGFVPGSFLEQDGAKRENRAFHELPGSVEGRLDGVSSLSFILPSESDLEERPAFTAPSAATPEYIVTPFQFQAERDSHMSNYSITINRMRHPDDANLDQDDLHLIREVLITPVDLSAHPKRNDDRFVESVRKYELRRLLKMVQYRAGAGWKAGEYERHLFEELWPFYSDASDKRTFLNTLLNNLLEYEAVTGGVFNSPYRRILSNMRSLR